ncbi:MAG: ABC transporter permease [Blastocatellia bacterium]
MLINRFSDNAEATPEELPELLIHPGRDGLGQYLRELRQYAGLTVLLLRRNIRLRYRQTLVGMAWAVLQPLLTMLIFTVLFGRLIKVPTGGQPYPVFALCALVPWTYFMHSLTLTSKCLNDHHELLTKVWFPRLILPLVAVLEATVDFFISFALLLLLLPLAGVAPEWRLLLAAPLILLLLTIALGVGLWAATLNLRYRDIGNALPFLIQLLLFATPVAYSTSIVPAEWRVLYGLNPLVGVMEGFRWVLLGARPDSPMSLAVSVTAAVMLFLSGLFFFRRREGTFADEV